MKSYKKILISAALFLMGGTLCVWADQPFRNQRYDALNVLDVSDSSIVFVGNSITNMHDWFDAYSSDQRVCGRGVSGAVSQELLDNIEAILIGHPAKIFILIGTNDLGTYFVDGNPNVEIPYNTMKKILTRIAKESPNTEVYLQAVLPTCGSTTYINRVPFTRQLNAKYKAFLEGMENPKFHFLDTFTPLLDGNLLKSSYAVDGIHLWASGYQIWCRFIETEVGIKTIYKDPKVKTYSAPTLDGIGGMHLGRYSYLKAFPVNDGDVLLVGDDFVNGGEWHELFHSNKVKNRGTGWGYNSFTIAKMTTALQAIVHDKPAPSQIWLCPAHGDANAATTVATYKTNLESFITKARSYCNTSKKPQIVLMATPPSNTAATNTNYITKYNAAMQEVADKYDYVDYVDIYTPLVSNGVANTTYSTGGRVYGKGYVKIAQTMLSKIQEADSLAFVLTDTQTNTLYSKIQARKTLGEYLSSFDDIQVGDGVGQYPDSVVKALKPTIDEGWTLLCGDPTVAEMNTLNSKLQTAFNSLRDKIILPKASTATEEHWYQVIATLRNGYYMTGAESGNNVFGAAANNYAATMWKFVDRGNGTYDIINRKYGTYISPTASYNSAIKVVKTRPTKGWTLSYANTASMFILSSGTVQLNQTTLTGNYVYNWSSGQDGKDRSDTGCQFTIKAYEGEPEIEPEEDPTLVKTVSDLTAGWYKMQFTTGISALADYYAANAEEEYQQTTSNQYPLLFQKEVNKDNLPQAWVYLTKNSSGAFEIRALDGHTITDYCTASRNTGEYKTIIANSSTGILSVKYWSNYAPGDGNTYIGRAYTANYGWKFFTADTTPFDIYTVKITGASNASTVKGDARVTCNNAQRKGIAAVYNNGFFFFPKGTSVTAEDFVATDLSASKLYGHIMVNTTSKTITCTYNNIPVGIEMLEADAKVSAKCYDLSGRTVSSTSKAKVYISEGQKFMKK